MIIHHSEIKPKSHTTVNVHDNKTSLFLSHRVVPSVLPLLQNKKKHLIQLAALDVFCDSGCITKHKPYNTTSGHLRF